MLVENVGWVISGGQPFGWRLNDLWIYTLGANSSDHSRYAATAFFAIFKENWKLSSQFKYADILMVHLQVGSNPGHFVQWFQSSAIEPIPKLFFRKTVRFRIRCKKTLHHFSSPWHRENEGGFNYEENSLFCPKEFFQRLFLLNVLQQKPSPSKQKGFLASAANKERELPLTVAMMTKLGNGN